MKFLLTFSAFLACLLANVSQSGSISDEVISQIDIMATLLAVNDIKIPASG